MHLGHRKLGVGRTEDPWLDDVLSFPRLGISLSWPFVFGSGCAETCIVRLSGAFAAAAFNTAFNRCGNDGLIPQLRQGGSIMFGFAVVGSKFDGTGLAKEQIVQTHVTWLALGTLKSELVFTDRLLPSCKEEAFGLCAVK